MSYTGKMEVYRQTFRRGWRPCGRGESSLMWSCVFRVTTSPATESYSRLPVSTLGRSHEFSSFIAVLLCCCSVASSVSRAMFCNGLRESHEERVEIKGLNSGTMSVLLDYTYTSRVHLTHSNVQRILEAASQFQVNLKRKLYFLRILVHKNDTFPPKH